MKIDLREVQTYYINLDRHKDKNEKMKHVIKNFGFSNVERISGADMPDDVRAGCATSHVMIFEKATPPFIILEDDCELYFNNPVIEIPNSTDALYLGLSSWALNNDAGMQWIHSLGFVDNYDHLHKVNNMLATHAILYLGREYIDMCKRAGEYSARNSVHIDVSFARFQRFFNVYALNDPTFYQSSNTRYTKIQFDDIKLRNFK